MSWRSVQLNNDSCDQDELIKELFKNCDVRYVGNDKEFAQTLKANENSSNLILIINYPFWISDIRKIITKNLQAIDKFYIGINRYFLLGNDTCTDFEVTNAHGLSLIKILTFYLNKQGYKVDYHGYLDEDQGKYFNFVQPLTWVYGSEKANSSN